MKQPQPLIDPLPSTGEGDSQHQVSAIDAIAAVNAATEGQPATTLFSGDEHRRD